MKSVVKKGLFEKIKVSFNLGRSQFYFFSVCSLLFPVIAVACFAADVRGVFFVALVSALFGGSGAWVLLQLWELKLQRSVSKIVAARLKEQLDPTCAHEISRLHHELEETRRGYEHQIDLLQSSVVKSKENVHQLNLEMDKKLEEMRLAYLEFEDLRKEYHRLEEEYTFARHESQKQLKHQESLTVEYQKTIGEQRTILEKKQLYIHQLEEKVRDLMYEIRSLLQLENVQEEVKTGSYDLSVQLQRCVEKAENLMGMRHLGGKSPRFIDPSDSYEVDRRRLFDSFQDETSGMIFVASLTERKFLFVNQQVKIELGWSSERFMKEFPSLVVEGYGEWKKALQGIRETKQCQSPLVFQTKSGERKKFDCTMGLVQKGPFTNHVIGIFNN